MASQASGPTPPFLGPSWKSPDLTEKIKSDEQTIPLPTHCSNVCVGRRGEGDTSSPPSFPLNEHSSTQLPDHPSTHPPIHLLPLIHPPIYQSICLLICPSIHPPAHLATHLPSNHLSSILPSPTHPPTQPPRGLYSPKGGNKSVVNDQVSVLYRHSFG